MNSLKFLAGRYGLRITLNARKQFVRGRAGRIICDADGDCIVRPYDLACVANGPLNANSVLELPIFDPTDGAQAELALEVIEAGGRSKLTRFERRSKIEALIQLRMAQSDCLEEGSA